MFRIYLTEAVKNIKSNITLSVIIVLLFTFLIQLISYSFAWITYNFWSTEIHNSGITNEAYIEYSIYSIQRKSTENYNYDIFISEKRYNPENPADPIIIPLTDEEKEYNNSVIVSYNNLTEQLKNINGYIFSGKNWGSYLKSDNGNAYELSDQGIRGVNDYVEIDSITNAFSDMGYTKEEISQFCDYRCVKIDIDTILMEGFTYCEGEGFTEDNLDFEYTITDGKLPTVPIVMGYEFKDFFDIGDVITNPEGRDWIKSIKEGDTVSEYHHQTFGHFVVVGFLDENTSIEYGPGVRYNVDNYIVVPYVPNIPQYFPNESEQSQIKDFYRSLPDKIIYIEKDNELATVEALSKALSEDTIVGMHYKLEKNTQANAVYRQMFEKRMINYALIAGSTLIFCIAVIILIIVNKFNSNIKDTAIHRLIGATVTDSVKTYVLEFAIHLLCADILSHYVYIIYAINPMSTILIGFWMTLPIGGTNIRLIYPLMLIMNILFLLLVAIISYFYSAKLDTASIIKGKE